GIPLAVHRDGERHIADVVGVGAGVLELLHRPAAQHHGGDLARVDPPLGGLPVGGHGVVLDQAAGHRLIQGVVDSVGAGAVAAVGKGVGHVGHIVVELGVAGGRAEDVGVPGTHGPAGGEVGVQGDGVGVVLDGLQVVEELVGGGGSFGDAGLLPDPLVVGHAVGVAAVGDAVDLAV